jgi:cysteine desulfurase
MPSPLLLDHAASTPVRAEALDAFVAACGQVAGGNPAAGHGTGRAARTVLEDARERIAAVLGRHPHEVVVTSGGTEADQLALVGTFRAAAEQGRRHVLCSAVEHPAVRDAVAWLVAREGATVTWVAPDAPVPVDIDRMLAGLRDDTALVCLTGADGELGLVQDVTALAAVLADRGVPLHVDAVQRVATRDLPRTGSLALSGHKLGAPVGVGVAVLPRDVPVRPLVDGPGQERGLRSGTQPAALAAALAVALELAVAERDDHAVNAAARTRRLAAALADVPGLRATLDPEAAHRLATHVHCTVDGVDGEALALALDAAGVHASTGTACATGSARPSPVLEACKVTGDASLRLSVGRATDDALVDDAADRVAEVVARLRSAGGGFL